MEGEKNKSILVVTEEMPPQCLYDLLVKTLGSEIIVKRPVLEVIQISNIPNEEVERVIMAIRDAGGEITEG